MHIRTLPLITAIAVGIPLVIYISLATASALMGWFSGVMFSLLFLFVFNDEMGDIE